MDLRLSLFERDICLVYYERQVINRTIDANDGAFSAFTIFFNLLAGEIWQQRRRIRKEGTE